MGKVIKGSAPSAERYTVTIPAYVPGAPAIGEPFGVDADGAPPDAFAALESAGIVPDTAPLPPAEPAVDLEALAVHARAIVDEAGVSARAILDDAHERARAIVEDAQAQAQAIAADARRAGHDEGRAAGERAAHDEMDEMLATFDELLEATREQRHHLIAAAEPELVRLAVGIAERVLHQQIALDGGVVVEMAKAAISRIVEREKITVRVNPADIERMREHRGKLLALGDVKTMRVIEDQRVDRGGVIIETDAGSVDAKIATQLTEVRKILHIVDDDVVVITPDDASRLPAARAS